MAQCKYCSKKGLFLSVTKNGLCKYCEVKLQSTLQNNMRRIGDSERIIETSKNPKTISERLVFLIELLSEFRAFEERGIQVFNHSIDALIEDKACAGNEVLLKILEAKFLVTLEKIKTIKTEKAKINLFEKFVLEAIDFKGYINKEGSNYDKSLDSIDIWIKELS